MLMMMKLILILMIDIAVVTFRTHSHHINNTTIRARLTHFLPIASTIDI